MLAICIFGCIVHTGNKSDLFLCVGLYQECFFTPRQSLVTESKDKAEDAALLFIEDVLPLALSNHDFQLDGLVQRVDVVRMRISTSNCKPIALSQERMKCPLQVGNKMMP